MGLLNGLSKVVYFFPHVHISLLLVGSVLLGGSWPYTRMCKCQCHCTRSLVALFSFAPGFALSSSIPVNLQLLFHTVAIDVLIHTYLTKKFPEKELSGPTHMYCDVVSSLKDQHFSLSAPRDFSSIKGGSSAPCTGSGFDILYPANGVSESVDLIFQLL